MQHNVLRLPPGSQSFNCPNLTQEHATTQKKTYPLTLTQTLTQTPNANLGPNLAEPKS